MDPEITYQIPPLSKFCNFPQSTYFTIDDFRNHVNQYIIDNQLMRNDQFVALDEKLFTLFDMYIDDDEHENELIQYSQLIKCVYDMFHPPAGFHRPARISDELADFLEVPHGTLVSRVDGSTKIAAYASEHNLHDPHDKRIYIPDAKLAALFKCTEPFMYYQIQKFLTPHFRR